MPSVMTLSGYDDDRSRPACKVVRGRGGTRRLCPVQRTKSGKWKWQFQSNGKSRRK